MLQDVGRCMLALLSDVVKNFKKLKIGPWFKRCHKK